MTGFTAAVGPDRQSRRPDTGPPRPDSVRAFLFHWQGGPLADSAASPRVGPLPEDDAKSGKCTDPYLTEHFGPRNRAGI